MASKKKAAEQIPTAEAEPTYGGMPAAKLPNAEGAYPVFSPEDGLVIVEMFVENIKRVKVVHIKPKGNMVVVGGANGSGKTSILDAITWALTGTSEIPTEVIRVGERVASIKLDIGEYFVTRYFTRTDPTKSEKGYRWHPKLLVEGKNRETFRSPQALLDGLMGRISFDPLAFTRMADKDQLKMLHELVTFDIDMAALEAQMQETYDLRRECGRERDSLKARLAALPEPPQDLPAEPINVDAILAQMREAGNHNNIMAARQQNRTRLQEDIKRTQEDAARMRSDAQAFLDRAQKLDGQIAAISIVSAPKDSEDFVSKLQRELESIVVAEPISTDALSDELQAANQTNTLIQRATQYRALAQELEEKEAAYAELDESYKRGVKEKADAMTRAKMPIEGLAIGDGEVMYKGLPFNQASNAEQIRVSMAIGIASNPKLRVVRIADGSLLDEKSLALIAEMAEAHKVQVWIERVGNAENVGVLMEDGLASGDDVVPVEEDGKNATAGN